MAHFVNTKHNNVCDHPQHTKNVTILETSKESLALACYLTNKKIQTKKKLVVSSSAIILSFGRIKPRRFSLALIWYNL